MRRRWRVSTMCLPKVRRCMGLRLKWPPELFNLMEKFADYGFNKSHSAAYADRLSNGVVQSVLSSRIHGRHHVLGHG